ncbi:hypothetical protein CSAL01_08632 [Colletotrichum salicis]|uniref:Uncharacterized protein n=1 Tax=Colletotrichum salicis TaxID=1209931 RepID=A0A135V8D9_9PEZI|nr:hypothetical protein CSAL01_08632 [Colletotrichum salicis]
MSFGRLEETPKAIRPHGTRTKYVGRYQPTFSKKESRPVPADRGEALRGSVNTKFRFPLTMVHLPSAYPCCQSLHAPTTRPKADARNLGLMGRSVLEEKEVYTSTDKAVAWTPFQLRPWHHRIREWSPGNCLDFDTQPQDGLDAHNAMHARHLSFRNVRDTHKVDNKVGRWSELRTAFLTGPNSPMTPKKPPMSPKGERLDSPTDSRPWWRSSNRDSPPQL